MSAVYKSNVILEHAALDASKVIEGTPTTGFLELGREQLVYLLTKCICLAINFYFICKKDQQRS